MATYESFNNKKRKLNHLWNKLNSQQDSANQLKKITVNLNDVAFTKNIFKQNILTDYLISSTNQGGTKTVIIDFPVFPSWAIPMAHILTVGKLTDANNPLNTSIDLITDKRWTELGTDHFELRLHFIGDAFGISDFPPLYINVDLIIINENQYSTGQTESN